MPLKAPPKPVVARKKRRRSNPEHDEQVKFVNWFRSKYPGVLVYAVPNGATLANGPTQWNYLKSEGAVPGIPDLHIPAWKVVIEMKRKTGGVVSPEQSQILAYFESIGWDTVVCHGCVEAKQFVNNFIKRMPGT